MTLSMCTHTEDYAPLLFYMCRIDKAPRPTISNVIWILSFDTGTSVATPLGPGARKVLANKTHFWGFNFTGKSKLALHRA